ncbi:HtaA domain-containing protein [Streptomyces sp. NPDC003077]|uniref:HtaA domain-containing protein n=1 Tax=Streptomyces sp. NPDC003077 TaxID=3154443 RepID=UPI0033B536E5
MTAIRRSLALAAAVATAAATTALVLPATALAADGVQAAPTLELKDGTLEWGVKKSFRDYVTGIAHGTVTATGGARQAPGNGPFTFTGGTGTYDLATHGVAAAFQGSVRFVSQPHGFDIRLADLKVSTQGTSGRITADITAAGATRNDVPLATLNLTGMKPGSGPGGAVTFAGIPAKLTAEGAKAFNNMYQAGQELDPATLSVKAASAPPSPAPAPGRPTDHGTRPSTEPATRPATEPSTRPTGHAAPEPEAKPTPAWTATARPQPGPSGAGTGAKPAATSGKVVDGAATWGVKKSFRDYVTGPIGGGTVQLAGGAVKAGDGYRFPKGHGTYDTGKSTVTAAFNGSVRFLAHAGALDMTFRDLTVKIDGTKGTLVADVTSKSRATGRPVHTPGLTVANLKVPAGAVTVKNGVIALNSLPATLTAAGAKTFENMYQAGQALDPVTLAVSVGAGARLPGGSGALEARSDDAGAGGGSGAVATGARFSGGSAGGPDTATLAATGAAMPSGVLAGIAAALVAAGGGAVYAARRTAF